MEASLAQNPKDRVAILYRTNSQSRQIEEALRRYGRQYIVVGGFSFYQRAEVKDIVAYLKLAVAPVDSLSLLRILNTPARGIGKTTVEQVETYARTYGLAMWNAIVLVLMVVAYGYPIGQFFILKSSVPAYEVTRQSIGAGAR